MVDLYELTMGQSYFVYHRRTYATFDLFVRNLPHNRSYLVVCGLEDILTYIKGLRFSDDDIAYLRSQKTFSEEFLSFLKRFRFSGDIWAMQEGEVCFAQEPILRVTAPIIEAQFIESFLLNTINLQTMIASKAARVVDAACGRGVLDFSLRRTHGAEAGLHVARSSYIAGCRGTSNVLAGKLYGIPVAGTMAHSFIMSFKDEMSAFLAYGETFPRKTILLVDTYTTSKGIDHAVMLGLHLKKKGFQLQGIRLDSGDIVKLSKLARKKLDAAGLSFVKIFASGNLDEFKIHALLKRKAQVDSFGVGTNMGTSIDAPALDVIYKISEVTDGFGNFLPTMKLSEGKQTFPGRKQVFRQSDRSGRFIKDVIGLETERIQGRPLLRNVVKQGKVIYRVPKLDDIRSTAAKNIACLPKRMRAIESQAVFPVAVSPGLHKLCKGLAAQRAQRQ